jgi:hypothetical protein
MYKEKGEKERKTRDDALRGSVKGKKCPGGIV